MVPFLVSCREDVEEIRRERGREGAWGPKNERLHQVEVTYAAVRSWAPAVVEYRGWLEMHSRLTSFLT